MLKNKIIITIILISTFCLSGCNKQVFDANYKFNKVTLIVGGQIAEFEIVSWNDYEDSDMVQFTTKDGQIYYTHASNVIFTNK